MFFAFFVFMSSFFLISFFLSSPACSLFLTSLHISWIMFDSFCYSALVLGLLYSSLNSPLVPLNGCFLSSALFLFPFLRTTLFSLLSPFFPFILLCYFHNFYSILNALYCYYNFCACLFFILITSLFSQVDISIIAALLPIAIYMWFLYYFPYLLLIVWFYPLDSFCRFPCIYLFILICKFYACLFFILLIFLFPQVVISRIVALLLNVIYMWFLHYFPYQLFIVCNHWSNSFFRSNCTSLFTPG